MPLIRNYRIHWRVPALLRLLHPAPRERCKSTVTWCLATISVRPMTDRLANHAGCAQQVAAFFFGPRVGFSLGKGGPKTPGGAPWGVLQRAILVDEKALKLHVLLQQPPTWQWLRDREGASSKIRGYDALFIECGQAGGSEMQLKTGASASIFEPPLLQTQRMQGTPAKCSRAASGTTEDVTRLEGCPS